MLFTWSQKHTNRLPRVSYRVLAYPLYSFPRAAAAKPTPKALILTLLPLQALSQSRVTFWSTKGWDFNIWIWGRHYSVPNTHIILLKSGQMYSSFPFLCEVLVTQVHNPFPETLRPEVLENSKFSRFYKHNGILYVLHIIPEGSKVITP